MVDKLLSYSFDDIDVVLIEIITLTYLEIWSDIQYCAVPY